MLPDLRGRILVDLGAGDDRLDSTLGFPAGSVLRMGDGADWLTLGDTDGRDLRLDLGPGDDVLDVQDSAFSRLLVEAGTGNDRVEFFFAGAGTLSVRLGDGDDLLRLDHGYFDGSVVLRGGVGADELELRENDFRGGSPKVVDFESRFRP